MRRPPLSSTFVLVCLSGCAATTDHGTLAELEQIPADVEEVFLDDSLERAAESYQRYLEETSESAMTPEAMRRLADLQIEREYGVIGGAVREMAAPETARITVGNESASSAPATPSESDQAFEQRVTEREELLSTTEDIAVSLPDGQQEPVPTGPQEAIKTYRKLLETYPNYERNDQVLYQMSRAHDELGQSDEAMAVMERLVAEYPYSKYIDEVHFRRGEYYFVRKRYLDAEDAYGAIASIGADSSYYELGLYKLGWTLYKQELYEDALNHYMAMLDHRQSIGYDFDRVHEEDEEHRVADTFRVVSLSFSNLGDADVVDEYFAEHGHRSYADKIYSNLGEFFFGKLRYDDAASVYKSFIGLNPFHRASPHFGMRIVEIYTEGGFPQLVVESKKEYATRYSLNAEYWDHVDLEESPEVVGFLKANLTDLANHYHALYQDEALVDERSTSFREAQNWYRQFLASFPSDPESPAVNYQLADLLLENGSYGEAAREYERTAYEYDPHEQASAAGYAAIYAHREDLNAATGARQLEVKRATVQSSLRFADTFEDHEQAPVVLGAAADDLYEMKDFRVAIDSARKLIDRYPNSDPSLLRSAWAVVANSSIDISEFENAEEAYLAVLELTPADDESLPDVIDGLAASIYKQGEQAILLEDYRTAANHFLRIKDVAPTSAIRTSAEYDAAAALINLQDWVMASDVLEEFRVAYPEHELNTEATKQLAYVYREDGQLERSAAEYERISAEATDETLSREALLTAGNLYDQAESLAKAIAVYRRYAEQFPRPLDIALETRTRLAEIFESRDDDARYHAELGQIVAIDKSAGEDRTDRSRFLAAKAAFVLAELSYRQFAEQKLTQPFEESLAEKQRRMDVTMAALEDLVEYEVAEVTAAATFYIAESFFEFSAALIDSERPAGLTEAEKVDYELVIEEEAYPFEERAIEVHEENSELLAAGVYNPWVQQSLDKLAILMPGRYAKYEISPGYVGSIDTYAYRMPIAPPLGVDGQEEADVPEPTEAAAALETAARVNESTAGEPQ